MKLITKPDDMLEGRINSYSYFLISTPEPWSMCTCMHACTQTQQINEAIKIKTCGFICQN